MPRWIHIQRHGNIVEEKTDAHHIVTYQEQILITSGDDDTDRNPRLPAPKIDMRAVASLIPIGVMIARQVLKWRNQRALPALPARTTPILPAPDETVIIDIHEPSNYLESR